MLKMPLISYHRRLLSISFLSTMNKHLNRLGQSWLYTGGTHLKKNFSTSDDGSSHSSDSPIKLPRRLVKRLQKQGIREDEFISKLEMSDDLSRETTSSSINSSENWSPEQKFDSTVQEYLVNKLPRHSGLEDIPEFPSDMPKYKEWNKKRKQNKSELNPNIDPSDTSVLLFPGQGSQFVGMGKALLHFNGVKDLYEEASQILGYDLLRLCLDGPKSELDKTIYCQPAVVITSLAAVEKLREEHPNAIENCVATAGFSVGEFTALVFAGVLSFPDALAAVKMRAEAMQDASERVASGMMTLFLAHNSDLKGALSTAKEYCKERRGITNPVCYVANYLFPECKVIAGHEPALEFLTANAKEFGLLRTRRLPVSGAFHTQLMKSAVPSLQKSLQGIQINKPKIPVYSNLTGQPYHEKANFVHKLCEQVVKPVKWEQTMHAIYTRDSGTKFPQTYEIGPSKQLGTLLKQVNMQAYSNYHHIDV